MPLLRKGSRQGRIARTALLLIDVINDLDFDREDELLVQAWPMARRLAALKRKASAPQIPSIPHAQPAGGGKPDAGVEVGFEDGAVAKVEHVVAGGKTHQLTGAGGGGARVPRAGRTIRGR